MKIFRFFLQEIGIIRILFNKLILLNKCLQSISFLLLVLQSVHFKGDYHSLTYSDLGSHAVHAALKKVPQIKAEDVEEIIFGGVLQANVGQAPAKASCFKSWVTRIDCGHHS